MVVVAACYALFPGTAFFVAVQAVALLAIIVFYFGVLRCLRGFGTPAPLQRLLALVLSMHALLLFRYGMEVTLALPLGIWTLAVLLQPTFRWTPRQTFTYGLLASLTTLSRLDSFFLMTLLMAAQTLTAAVPWPDRLKRIAIYCAGWFPFLLYLAVNVGIFHALLPVSGSAKQLKPFWPPSARPILGLFFPLDRNKAAFVYPAALLIVAAAFVLLRRLQQRRPTAHVAILVALFLFPVLHYAILCALSDWTVWPWYYYSLVYALLAATMVLLISPAPAILRTVPIALAASVLALGFYLTGYAVLKRPSHVLRFVSDFANVNPGIYAMGDGAGTPAFFSASPFIQLEGLTMDADYLQALRTRTPLADVLRRYQVDFYVTFRGIPDGPCLHFNEPQQGGPRSPKLQGRVCVPPLARTVEHGLELDIYRASDVLAP